MITTILNESRICVINATYVTIADKIWLRSANIQLERVITAFVGNRSTKYLIKIKCYSRIENEI